MRAIAGAKNRSAAPAVAWQLALRTIPLEADERAPGKVRRLLGDIGLQEKLSVTVESTAQLLASEMITNSVLAYGEAGGEADGEIAVGIEIASGQLFVAVGDSAPGVPVLKTASVDREAGRGLAIVQALSLDWGWAGRPGRKVVWFSLSLDMAEAEAEPDLDAWAEPA